MFSRMFCCLFMIAAVSLAGVAGCVEPPQPAPEPTNEVPPAPETTDEVQSAIPDEDRAVEPEGERSTLGPYAIVFIELDARVRVISVMHGHRQPAYWRRRI